MNPRQGNRQRAFTLIELLVVIAIIGILAALTFPALRAAKIASTRSKVRAELRQVESAIEAYKVKYGFYPPDNPGRPQLNQLFYELQGTARKGAGLVTLDGRETIPTASVPLAFGAGVSGFVNCTREGAEDDSKVAQSFLGNLRPDQYAILGNTVRYGVLVCSVPWPATLGNILPGVPEVNPWRYVSSNPTNNPKSFDLWVDIQLGGKTNRISNWNKEYQVVN
jgi:prepilin-type N-terminal cleavage/methylation domain-containing protein